MKKGQIIVISGPSGVGKGTIVKELTKHLRDVQFSVSATTRAPRPSEIDGVHYHFVTHERFAEMVANNQLLEHATYVSNSYGTPAEPVDRWVEEGKNVILEIEVDGALQVKQNRPDAVLIFIVAPSFDELSRRLLGRGDTSPEAVEKRLARAREEYRLAPKYDYIVVNDTVEQATDDVLTILKAHSHRPTAMIDYLKEEN